MRINKKIVIKTKPHTIIVPSLGFRMGEEIDWERAAKVSTGMIGVLSLLVVTSCLVALIVHKTLEMIS